MQQNRIYSLHEYGAPSHLFALEHLAKQKGYTLHHRELNISRQLGSSLKNLNIYKFRKFLVNNSFIWSLFFSKNKTVLLALAPYNYWLYLLRYILKGHRVFYFTSYTCWDQTRMEHSMFYSTRLLQCWRRFLRVQAKHIFAVSEKSKQELVLNNFSKSENVSVVYHSYNIKIQSSQSEFKTNKFIYAGRLESSKGIEELILIFSGNPEIELTILGKGTLEPEVNLACEKYSNIKYAGFVYGLDELIPFYKENSFLILNSKKTKTWEELFGLTLIEGMACGLVPIASAHPGPMEIINHNVNGLLYREGEIVSGILRATEMSTEDFFELKRNAIARGQEFESSNISKRWGKIFE